MLKMKWKLFTLILLLLGINLSSGQFIDYNHPELRWKTFETEHFVVHFHQGTQHTALLVGKIAEEIYPHVTGLYNYRPKEKFISLLKIQMITPTAAPSFLTTK